MAINPYWERWIFASISQHFTDSLGSHLPLFIEGQKRWDTERTTSDFAELRVDGPYYTEENKDYWRLYLEVNIMIHSSLNDTDFHKIRRSTGIVAKAFSDISLYKYGDNSYDDQSLFGCLRLINGTRGRERIQVTHYGQIEPNLNEVQATVEAHYVVFLNA